MTDLSQTIVPKSDQMNSDDLIGGPITIKITRVYANTSSAEQPISISYEGDNGKPYKPCKSMRRVLVQVWGKDGASFVGRSMTLYRDPGVTWGGLAVGGIRISHMSDIDAPVTMALTATKQSRKPFTVKPLAIEKPRDHKQEGLDMANQGLAKLAEWWTKLPKSERPALEAYKNEVLKPLAQAADTEKEAPKPSQEPEKAPEPATDPWVAEYDNTPAP